MINLRNLYTHVDRCLELAESLKLLFQIRRTNDR